MPVTAMFLSTRRKIQVLSVINMFPALSLLIGASLVIKASSALGAPPDMPFLESFCLRHTGRLNRLPLRLSRGSHYLLHISPAFAVHLRGRFSPNYCGGKRQRVNEEQKISPQVTLILKTLMVAILASLVAALVIAIRDYHRCSGECDKGGFCNCSMLLDIFGMFSMFTFGVLVGSWFHLYYLKRFVDEVSPPSGVPPRAIERGLLKGFLGILIVFSFAILVMTMRDYVTCNRTCIKLIDKRSDAPDGGSDAQNFCPCVQTLLKALLTLPITILFCLSSGYLLHLTNPEVARHMIPTQSEGGTSSGQHTPSYPPGAASLEFPSISADPDSVGQYTLSDDEEDDVMEAEDELGLRHSSTAGGDGHGDADA